MQQRVELHLIRRDVLLWALGGFAEGPEEDPFIAAMRRQMTAEGRFAYGTATELGARYGLTAKNARLRIHRARKRGLLPVKIDKNVPVPKRGGASFKYDWSPQMAALEIGDSFFEPTQNPKSAELIRASMKARGRTLGFEVTTRRLTENGVPGVRCWRIA